MDNWLQTVISQFGNSPTLLALIERFNDAVDPGVDIDAFYSKVWNVLTAQGWGLDVWGRIVGVSRVLTLPATDYFGFEEAPLQPFGQAPMFSPENGSTTNYVLTDDAFRVLILVRALSNISNSSIKTYNTILMELFPGRGNAYVTDTGNMTERLTFEFPLQPFEVAILKESGALSPPTGVGFEIMVVDLPNEFGFAEAGSPSAQGFGNGILFGGFA